MDLEYLLGVILVIGVVSGLVILATGLAMYIYTHGLGIDLRESIEYSSISSWIGGLGCLDIVTRILSIGLVIVILTPYVRAIASLIWFIYHRDWKFVLLTVFVSIVLTLSITGLLRAF